MPGIGLFDRSRLYSSTQKSFFGFGSPTLRRVAIGFTGMIFFMSGRSAPCGCGDVFRGNDGDRVPFDGGADNCAFCGAGGGGGGPDGNT